MKLKLKTKHPKLYKALKIIGWYLVNYAVIEILLISLLFICIMWEGFDYNVFLKALTMYQGLIPIVSIITTFLTYMIFIYKEKGVE